MSNRGRSKWTNGSTPKCLQGHVLSLEGVLLPLVYMQRKDACSRDPMSSGTGLDYPCVCFSSPFPEKEGSQEAEVCGRVSVCLPELQSSSATPYPALRVRVTEVGVKDLAVQTEDLESQEQTWVRFSQQGSCPHSEDLKKLEGANEQVLVWNWGGAFRMFSPVCILLRFWLHGSFLECCHCGLSRSLKNSCTAKFISLSCMLLGVPGRGVGIMISVCESMCPSPNMLLQSF